MGYIDILIPLSIGVLAIVAPQSLIKIDDPAFEKKKSLFQRIGYGLVGVAIVYAIIKALN